MFGWFKRKKKSPVDPQKETGLRRRLRDRLSRTRESLVSGLDRIFSSGRKFDQELIDDLEELLITADLGVATTGEIIDHIRKTGEEADSLEAVKGLIRDKILSYLDQGDTQEEPADNIDGPRVIMVLGVNGVGKTTTIGKLAHKFVAEGSKVMLVAADTFRAAAVEQLKIWGERVGCEVVARPDGTDPSSVVFDALNSKATRQHDIIIVDTAGRMHTQVNLMEELKKIKRVMGKKMAGAPHEVLMVLDATTGQNGISQARMFNEAVDLTGIVLSKLDGTAKGGIAVNICRELSIPIRFIGVGEQIEDLRDFDPAEFVSALFDPGPDQPAAGEGDEE